MSSLLDRIEPILHDMLGDRYTDADAADIVRAVIEYATSDAAVERAEQAFSDNDYSVRAAILAALDGEGGT